MKNFRILFTVLLFPIVALSFNCCAGNREDQTGTQGAGTENLNIGWASEDISPDKPVIIMGQFYARISEGVKDPITVTALAIESGKGESSEKVIIISCDLAIISDGLRDTVRELLKKSLPELLPQQIILNATHAHSATQYSAPNELSKKFMTNTSKPADIKSTYGIELDAMELSECLAFISVRIAKAAKQAWENRKPGGISYGLGHAVVGHNRLSVDMSGKSTKIKRTHPKDFSHIEGYEDHSVNLLYTWDKDSRLTGVVINIASPSQVIAGRYKISADYWHETRVELRQRLGKDVYFLPQCSSAGDQAPHAVVDIKAEKRMQQIMWPDIETGRGTMGRRKQIAMRIADAVTYVLPYMKDNIEWNPVFVHQMEIVELSRRLLSIEDVEKNEEEAMKCEKQYQEMLLEIEENPEMKLEPGWYREITRTHRKMLRGYGVKDRYELEKTQPKMPVEVHVIRIGDVVMATNPFELYLDYGIRIKVSSPAVQTFLVQLAGSGSYLPPTRSIAGGAYGAVPASTLIGPEGGQELVEETLRLINTVWNKK